MCAPGAPREKANASGLGSGFPYAMVAGVSLGKVAGRATLDYVLCNCMP
jgi:hypothetical protein